MKIIYVLKSDYEEMQTGNFASLRDYAPPVAGVDHFEVTKNQIKLYDRGNNNVTHDYIIRSIARI